MGKPVVRSLTAAECAARANTAAGLAARAHETNAVMARDHYIRESANWFALAWNTGYRG